MEMLEYKGYLGNIEYSKTDNCLHGQVLGLNKKICIVYEGNTAEELYNDFRDGVDHYLECCKEDGIQPEKTYNGMLNIQIPYEIHVKAATFAKNQGTSVDTFVCDLIERQLESAY